MVHIAGLALLDLERLGKPELASLEKRVEAELTATRLKLEDLEALLAKIKARQG